MADFTAADVGKLREMTGAGLMDCKKALTETKGSIEAAVDLLRKKGQASAAKKSSRQTREGVIAQNIQAGARAGILVEINCETDFVARSEQFIKFAHEVALQVAAAAPRYIKEEDIPAEVLEHETEIAKGRAREEGKPEAMLEKIAQGRLEKFKDEVVLLRQPYIRDDKVTIGKLLLEQVASIGENIVVRRIVRWELGEVSG
jgi:elongation factor Ts